eukprot:128294_1
MALSVLQEGHQFVATIPKSNLKAFAKILQCMAKTGANLTIEASDQHLIFWTLNQAESAMFQFSFGPPFFDSFEYISQEKDLSGIAPVQDSLRCRVKIRGCLNAVKSLQDIDRLIFTVNDKECTVGFELVTSKGIHRLHTFQFQDQNHDMQTGVTREGMPYVLVSSAHLFTSVVSNFHSGVEELSLIPKTDVLMIKSFIDDQANESKLSEVIHTEQKLHRDMFTAYEVPEESPDDLFDLTFCLREFKAFLIVCDTCQFDIHIFFEAPGAPVLLSTHQSAFGAGSQEAPRAVVGDLILATFGAAAMSQAGPSRQSAGQPAPNQNPPNSSDHQESSTVVSFDVGSVLPNHSQSPSVRSTAPLQNSAPPTPSTSEAGDVRSMQRLSDEGALRPLARPVTPLSARQAQTPPIRSPPEEELAPTEIISSREEPYVVRRRVIKSSSRSPGEKTGTSEHQQTPLSRSDSPKFQPNPSERNRLGENSPSALELVAPDLLEPNSPSSLEPNAPDVLEPNFRRRNEPTSPIRFEATSNRLEQTSDNRLEPPSHNRLEPLTHSRLEPPSHEFISQNLPNQFDSNINTRSEAISHDIMNQNSPNQLDPTIHSRLEPASHSRLESASHSRLEPAVQDFLDLPRRPVPLPKQPLSDSSSEDETAIPGTPQRERKSKRTRF